MCTTHVERTFAKCPVTFTGFHKLQTKYTFIIWKCVVIGQTKGKKLLSFLRGTTDTETVNLQNLLMHTTLIFITATGLLIQIIENQQNNNQGNK